MKLLVTTNARIYKSENGIYWANMVYGYDFFKRYLKVFDEIKLVAHCEECMKEDTNKMIRVDGEGLNVFEIPFPHGKKDYIKKYFKIKSFLKHSYDNCDAAILRIPDQLAFQIYPFLKKNNIPVAVEVTSDSWDFFSPGSVKSKLRPFLRILWHFNQKYICSNAYGTSYVTKKAIQKRYPPKNSNEKFVFTTNYTDTNIKKSEILHPRDYSNKKNSFNILHVSGSISGYAKGHKELISAFNIIRKKSIDVNLVLVGKGSLNKDIQEIIKKEKLEKYIRCTGMISDVKKLIEEYKNADIFVFPSYREGLPRVVLEAMANALPCITTNLPGVRELLDENCLVPVKNDKALAKKIEEFVLNVDILNEESYKNAKKIEYYCLEEVEKKRDQFYRNLKKISELRSKKK